MRAARWMVGATIAAMCSVVTVVGCHGSATTIGASEEAGIPAVVLTDASWGQSECAGCTFDACSAQRSDCQAEPACAVYLDCIEVCAQTSEGDPDPGCVAGCPLPPSSAAEHARLSFESCRTVGAATSCTTCAAAQRRRFRNPALTSFCADGTYDASPDDTPAVTACASCGAKKCCAPHKAYLADPDASALRTCLAACTNTDSCFYACDAKYDGSLVTWWTFFTCISILCPTECGVPPGTCASCVDSKCGDEHAACESDHDCIVLSDCVGACGANDMCQAACRAKYPGAVDRFAALILCGDKYCPACH